MRKDKDIYDSADYTTPTFYSNQIPVLNVDEIDLSEAFSTILESIEKFVNEGSGWKVDRL